MVASIQNTMHSFISQLIRNISAAITKYAPHHVQLNVLTYIFFDKCSSFKLVSCTCLAMLITQVLQMTFACLITDGTIKRMIDQ